MELGSYLHPKREKEEEEEVEKVCCKRCCSIFSFPCVYLPDPAALSFPSPALLHLSAQKQAIVC